jgi:S1-C subfamily serine protease
MLRSPCTHPGRAHGRGLPLALLVGMAASGASGPLGAQKEKKPQATLEELASHATPAVVLIDVKTASGSRQGSGFIVDPSGRIVTNHHVIRDARSARVKLASGDVYDQVQILADDPRRDIAILQIAGFDLPSLAMGNSDSLRVGSPVVLIGSPLGLENTVSTGIVSGRRQEAEGYQLIQVSAPASSGSSGGPLLTGSGDVMGIAVSQMEAGQNLNFAVPINYVRGLLDHLGAQPLGVLTPTAANGGEDSADGPRDLVNAVNQGLSYRLQGFTGYQAETGVDLSGQRHRRTRITYRLIESVGKTDPQIERYLESETTHRTEPFGTVQTLRHERSRVVARAQGLRPVTAKGETTWWNGDGWVSSSYDLRFQDDHVLGAVTDTTGHTVDIDRDLPPGIILRDMSDLAFALLSADSLVGRSVEFSAFDPSVGVIEHERYDVRRDTTISIGGRSYPALRVNVAKGLDNETLFVRAAVPRVFLRRENDNGTEVEEITSLDLFPSREGGPGSGKGGAAGGSGGED